MGPIASSISSTLHVVSGGPFLDLSDTLVTLPHMGSAMGIGAGSALAKVPRSPPPSSPSVTAVMKANRPSRTGPEMRLRKALSSIGVRGYRTGPSGVPGRPDLAFGSARVAVFVHGCFWHRHGCSLASTKLPKSNRPYWRLKFDLNEVRDARKVIELRKLGWRVLTLWECEVKSHPERCASRVQAAVAKRSGLRRAIGS